MRLGSVWMANAAFRGMKGPAGPSSSCPAAPDGQVTFSAAEGLRNVHFDTIVVGGGVFGCTTAHKLKASGQKVALIEARTVGSGTSGHSTAKLSAQQGTVYSMISEQHNDEVAKKYYNLNMHGIIAAEKIVNKLNLDCEFERKSHTAWTCQSQNVATIEKEYNVCNRLGIPCEMLDSSQLKELPPSIGAIAGISFHGMAHFNPYKYCKELCGHIDGDGSRVFESTRVSSVEQLGPHRVHMEETNSLMTADNVVLATHMPILDRSLHFAILEPSRSHCVAARVRNNPLQNMFINVEQPMRSLRASGDVVVLAGDATKQGDDPLTQKYYDDLSSWLRRHYEVEEILCQWSAMDYYSGDHIPFIGPLYKGTETMYTATGFSKWGLACGVAGADIVNAMIHGDRNPEFLDIVDARRWDLVHQWRVMAEETKHTGTHFIADKLKTLLPKKNIKQLNAGEGDIVGAGVGGLLTVGAYRDAGGELHVVHPTCTHLGCTLVFNDGDKAWDCPCHGSRFDVDGDVLHGPATKRLHKYKDLEW